MAIETTNYKFNKPAENEYYDVRDQNQNWDVADMMLKELDDGKVDASGGDIAATKVGSFTESAANYPVPAVNDTVKVGFGKIKKFFGDIRNWMTGVCLIGQIVNNCVTNNAGLPLSAAQGKVLMDLYTKLNTDLNNRITAANLTQADALAYMGRNYDIAVGVDADLTGIGSVGYGYFSNRRSGLYDLQHYFSLKYYCAYERVITESGNTKNWSKLVTSSDFESIAVNVNTIKDTSVAIAGAPKTNDYIPVIIGHTSNNHVFDNVFYDVGKWQIYSSISQITRVVFYKFPK